MNRVDNLYAAIEVREQSRFGVPVLADWSRGYLEKLRSAMAARARVYPNLRVSLIQTWQEGSPTSEPKPNRRKNGKSRPGSWLPHVTNRYWRSLPYRLHIVRLRDERDEDDAGYSDFEQLAKCGSELLDAVSPIHLSRMLVCRRELVRPEHLWTCALMGCASQRFENFPITAFQSLVCTCPPERVLSIGLSPFLASAHFADWLLQQHETVPGSRRSYPSSLVGKPPPLKPIHRRVLRAIYKHNLQNKELALQVDIADRMHCSRAAVSPHCIYLQQEGYIDKPEGNKCGYAVAEPGLPYIERKAKPKTDR